MAPPDFVLLHAGILGACVASALQAKSSWVRYCEFTGLALGMLPVIPLVYASGAIMEEAFWPWAAADERKQQTYKYKETSGDASNAFKSEEAPPGDAGNLRDQLSDLGLEFCQDLIELEGLTWATMVSIVKNTGSHSLLDKMLGDAGVDKAGHRAAIVLRIQEEIVRTKEEAPQIWSKREWITPK
jgi:hypothetical protein